MVPGGRFISSASFQNERFLALLLRALPGCLYGLLSTAMTGLRQSRGGDVGILCLPGPRARPRPTLHCICVIPKSG